MLNVLKKSGLYDGSVPLNKHFVHIEPIREHTPSYNYEIKPHIHPNLFQVQLVTEGGFTFHYEGKQMQFQGPALMISPDNTLHGFDMSPETDGYVITLSVSLLDKILSTYPEMYLDINQLRSIQILKTNEVYMEILEIISKLDKELINTQLMSDEVLYATFLIFFINIFRLVKEKNASIYNGQKRDLSLFRSFQSRIKMDFPETRTIKEYAMNLGVTTVHLNRICRKVAEKTSSEILQEYLISKVKQYLTHTDYTISEVSYMVSFADPSYFCRFFKAKTGVTPSEYRLKHSGN